MKQFIKKNFLRLWVSGFAGMGTGMIVEMLVGIFYKPSIPFWIQVIVIVGSAIGAWYIIQNNKGFGKV